MGTFAVQIAKSFGAAVTGVRGTRNAGLVRSLGADRVLDHTREDFTARGDRCDVFFDLAGNHPLAACRRVLKPDGTYVGAGGPGSRRVLGLIARPAAMLLSARLARQKLVTYLARPDQADLIAIGELIAAGKLTPVIDRRYRLSEAGAALKYLHDKHARGKVVIDPAI